FSPEIAKNGAETRGSRWLGGRRGAGSALGAVLRDFAVQQVRVDRLVDAGVAAVVRRVAIAVTAQEYSRIELVGEGDGLLVRRGRIAGGADDQDRRGALAVDLRRFVVGFDRPRRTAGLHPGEDLAEHRRRLLVRRHRGAN